MTLCSVAEDSQYCQSSLFSYSPMSLRSPSSDNGAWTCTSCTYRNHDALHLACGVCGTPRTSTPNVSVEERNSKLDDTSHSTQDLQEDTQDVDSCVACDCRDGNHNVISMLDRLVANGKISPAPAQAWKAQQPMFESWRNRREDSSKHSNKNKKETKEQEPSEDKNKTATPSNDKEKDGMSLLERLVATGKLAPETAQAWKEKQPLLNAWNTENKARELQLEEMRLHQEEILEELRASQA